MRSAAAVPVVCLLAALLAPACGFFHRGPEVPAVVDLNTASQRRIAALPGITPSIAARIVAGRPYEEPDDLVQKDILTERELRRIEDQITVKRRER